MPKQRLMTRAEFEWFAAVGALNARGRNGPVRIYTQPPFDLTPCECGDVNCHGWRFVERRAAARPDLRYEAVYA